MEPKSISTQLNCVGFIPRFIAYLIDFLILLTFGLGLNFAFGRSLLNTEPVHPFQYLLSFLLGAFYSIGFWVAQDGQTPGKRALHIKIVKEDGSQIDLFSAVIRYLGEFVSIFTLGAGYLLILIDNKKQGLHDKIAKTCVIQSDNQKPSPIVYLLGCLIPTLFIFGFIGLFSLGVYQGINNAKEKMERNQTKSMDKLINEMNPEAKKHWDRSQELFNQMREVGSKEKLSEQQIKTQVRKLNDENITELKRAIELESNNHRLWYELGNAYTWLSTNGSLEDSLLAHQKALELNPENITYINGVGDAQISLGKYEEAIITFQKTLRLTNNSGYANKSIGSAYQSLKIYDKAREYYQKALQIFKEENKDGAFDKDILEIEKELSVLPKS